MNLFRQFVETYNASTAVGKVTWEQNGPFSARVKSQTSGRELVFGGQIIDDLDIQPNGVVRITGGVSLSSSRTLEEAQPQYDPNSMSGFNLVYRVSRATERYGAWIQFRFEFHPFTRLRGPTNWFALGLHQLPRELQHLSAMGTYQHEQRPLDEIWWRELLLKIL